MPHNAMIELEAAEKRYGAARRGRGAAALQDVSLSIRRGSTLAVVGPNGAGKTTLFGLILGFLRPTSGAVSVDGMSARSYARTHGVGYLPERFSPPPQWRVRETLRGMARADGLPVTAGDAAMERWDLGAYGDREMGALSHGLLQRVALAQALLAPRELVVLDEPTEGLDPLWRVRLREAVQELRAQGRTVLVASHDLAEVERMCERAVLLQAGRVRETLDNAVPPARTLYRITLAVPGDFAAAFPDSVALAEADAYVFEVSVDDADELSTRLAAAIAGGARIVSVTPVREPLESRVQRALDQERAT